MNTVPNRKAICDVVMEEAKKDTGIVVLCSDSRGSASLTPFADAFPGQFVELGIAEQNLVSVSAGLAKCGKNRLRLLRPVFYPPEAMNSARLTWHTLIPM